jgi:hypothetical protein
MEEPDTIEYLDPVSPNRDKKLFVPAVGALKDKTIAFVTNGWSSYNAMGEHIAKVFGERFGIRMRTYAIPTSCAPEPGLLDRVAEECDAAVVGMAN